MLVIFIRIEPSSSTPIYRQIIDQVKYQVVTGVLKEGDKVPSVRELAGRLAVNQNTILKVYNELCRENILKIVRGEGTFVSSSKQKMPVSQRRSMVADAVSEAALLAVQLGIGVEEVQSLLAEKYDGIISQRNSEEKTKSPKKENA